jgi:hypothetical protein
LPAAWDRRSHQLACRFWLTNVQDSGNLRASGDTASKISTYGYGAAFGNAVCNATGNRMQDLPIRIESLL